MRKGQGETIDAKRVGRKEEGAKGKKDLVWRKNVGTNVVNMTSRSLLVPCSTAGKPNAGFYMMMNELPQERLLIATICAASMEFMYETTRNYVAERKAFRGTLANLQTIQHKIAEVYTGSESRVQNFDLDAIFFSIRLFFYKFFFLSVVFRPSDSTQQF